MTTVRRSATRHGSHVRAVGLVRVSSGEDSEHSPEVQARAIIKHAEDHGYLLHPRDILDENVDGNGKVRKVSGSWDLSDRPKLAQAVAMIERGTHQVVIGERFDRLFRDIDLQRRTINRVEAAGGRLESPKQGALSHATAEAELHANIDGVVAQYHKRTSKDRAWDAVEVAIEEGRAPGVAPPGYRRGDDGVFAPADRKTVKVVREAFERRANGATYEEVRTFLGEHGIDRTLGGVRKMLASRLYVGEVHFGRHTPNLHAHKPIVDRDVFERVQRTRVSAGRKAKSERLLARQGILRCGTCGGKMSAGRSGERYVFYRCGSDRCSRPVTIAAEPIERAVVEATKEFAVSRKGRARAAQRATRAAEEADRAQERLEKAIRVLAGFGDEQAAHERLAELRAERDHKREDAERLAAVTEPEVTVDVAAALDHGTLAERRSVIRARVKRVTVAPGRDPDRVTIELLGE